MNIEEIGDLSLKSTNPVKFTTGCAVFAESEAVSRIAEGASPADILAGVHMAMSAKIINLATRLGLVHVLKIPLKAATCAYADSRHGIHVRHDFSDTPDALDITHRRNFIRYAENEFRRKQFD